MEKANDKGLPRRDSLGPDQSRGCAARRSKKWADCHRTCFFDCKIAFHLGTGAYLGVLNVKRFFLAAYCCVLSVMVSPAISQPLYFSMDGCGFQSGLG